MPSRERIEFVITITLPESGLKVYVIRIGINQMRIMNFDWSEVDTETLSIEDLAYALECVLEYESRFLHINKGGKKWN